MPGRIITMQRQVRELGRLRTGHSGPKGPIRSKTWILTSPQRDCLDTAAEIWGGTVQEWTPLNGDGKQWKLTTEQDSLDALLPPGDPLTQANEMWNKGGAVRRCDGETDSKSRKPCLCLAQFGEEWFRQDARSVCRPYSQLNIILPQLPDLGVWRHVTKSYYAAGEIAGMVDLIKAQVGINAMVPVRIRIDPRKKVAEGRTTPYPVPVIEIRGATGGQILAGNVPSLAIEGGPAQQALTAGPDGAEKLTEDKVIALAETCKNIAQVQQLWRDAGTDGALTDRVKTVLTAKSAEFKPAAAQDVKPVSAPPAGGAPVDADVEPNLDEVWAAIVAAAPATWKTSELEAKFAAAVGKPPSDANGWEYEEFLRMLKSEQVPA